MVQRLLTQAILLMLLIAGVALGWVLYQTTQTAPPEQHDIAVFDLTLIAAGEYRWLDCDCGRQEKILLINDWQQQRYAFLVTMEQGRIALPMKPGQPQQWCERLQPETTAQGKMRRDAKLVCLDDGMQHRLWNIKGQSLRADSAGFRALPTQRKGRLLYIQGQGR